METIHVKFEELTARASKYNNSRSRQNCLNFQDSSEDSNETPSKEDLDNLFGPPYTPSSSLVIIEDNECPQIVSSLEEPLTNEPTTLVSDNNADESVQEDTA
ncbi:hypothetical protein Tco_0759067 [Tanacetum coccineum]